MGAGAHYRGPQCRETSIEKLRVRCRILEHFPRFGIKTTLQHTVFWSTFRDLGAKPRYSTSYFGPAPACPPPPPIQWAAGRGWPTTRSPRSRGTSWVGSAPSACRCPSAPGTHEVPRLGGLRVGKGKCTYPPKSIPLYILYTTSHATWVSTVLCTNHEPARHKNYMVGTCGDST